MPVTESAQIAAMIQDVRIYTYEDTGLRYLGSQDRFVRIEPVWKNVDRPITGSWTLRDTPANRVLAERVKLCMLDGAFFRSAEVRTDINGKTYVEPPLRFFWKRLRPSDLTGIGY